MNKLIYTLLFILVLASLWFVSSTNSTCEMDFVPISRPNLPQLEPSNEPVPTPPSSISRTTQAAAPKKDNKDQVVAIPPSIESQLLVSGRIVNSANNPVEGVRISLAAKEYWDTKFLEKFAVWEKVKGLTAVSGTDGVFRLTGEVSPGTYRMDCSHFQYLTQHETFNLGERGVLIILSSGWKIAGKLIIDEDIRFTEFWVAAQSLGPNNEFLGRSVTDLRSNGKFVLNDIPEGKIELALHTGRTILTGLSQPILLGPKGGSLVLPDIDLRATIQKIEITVQDPKGNALPYPWLQQINGPVTEAGDQDGLITFISIDSSLDILVGSHNFRTKRVPAVNGNMEIRLVPGIQVQVNLANEVSLPENCEWVCRLTLLTEPTSPTRLSRSQGYTYLKPANPVGLPESGWYQFELFLLDKRKDDEEPDELQFFTYQPVGDKTSMPTWFIEDQEAIQTFTYRLIPSDRVQALSLLRKDGE